MDELEKAVKELVGKAAGTPESADAMRFSQAALNVANAVLATRNLKPDSPQWTAISDEQIKHMVDRFLSWRLPETFNPDGGIVLLPSPPKREPFGTNLLDATQATEMVRHMVEGLFRGRDDVRPDEAP